MSIQRGEDTIFERRDGRAIITIDRPEVMNAFRAETIDEMNEALTVAADDSSVGAIVITGSGDRSFCVGGDATARSSSGYEGSHAGSGIDIDRFHYLLRAIPKPVIAAVNGYAIGGGNVIQVICDLAIASETAVFGQVGPKVGSVDAGFGTSYLARLVGERKAREIWFLCRRYTAAEALEMGLINHVVPQSELMAEVDRWCDEILTLSPTAIKIAKQSFALDTEAISATSRFAMTTLELFYRTDESNEGRAAFSEKRTPDFARFRSDG